LVRTLYVGNLPWSTSSEELTAAFAQYGEIISGRIITDRETGRSRGYGFVEVSDNDAGKVIEAMHGAEFGGRILMVSEAKPRKS
jgi:RNA recognition motif-containing protein